MCDHRTRTYLPGSDGRTLVEADPAEWMLWFGANPGQRIVGHTRVNGAVVSTVFIGLEGCLFETLVWSGPCRNIDDRYTTWGEAERGHEAIVARVRAAQRAE